MPEEPEDPQAEPEPEEFAEPGEAAPEYAEEYVEQYAEELVEDAEPAPQAAGEQVLQPCPNCAALLDVSDEEPFAQVHCPMCGTLMRARTQLKNFALVELLGAGGMGAVYKANDVNLNRIVALKVVRKEYSSDTEYLAKFEREARITASVNHPHVVKVFSFGSDHGLFYIAMEAVDKGSLDDLMNLQGRVGEAQVLEVGIQIAQGLQAAHNKGLIHRDVKPGNILFADAHTAKIVDFGLALLAEHEAEERGEVWGTPYYVAPEKLNHEPEDFRSDIYSLGGTLFHALAGRPPFEAETASLVALKHIKSKAVSLQAFAPNVASATAFVINRMLHKDPAGRYQTYDELLEHLQYARAQLLEAAAKPQRQKARVVVEGEQQQKVMGIISLILILAMLAGGALVYIYRAKLFNKGAIAAAGGMPQQTGAIGYQAARMQLLDGNFQGAEDALTTLQDQPDIAQPLENWIILHEGFSAWLAGRAVDANSAFKALADKAFFPEEKPLDAALGKFFAAVAKLAAGKTSVPPDAAKNFDLTSCGALAPFIFAAKDWELGRFEDANVLLQTFLGSNPAEPYAWIAEYKPLAQKYAADFDAYEKVNDQIKAASTPEQRAAALKALESLSTHVHGKMAETTATMLKNLRRHFTELEQNQARQIASERDGAVKTLNAAKAKVAAAWRDYDFPAALAAVQAAKISGNSAVETERATMLKKATWLDQFKKTLVRDINYSGYPLPVFKKNGVTVAGGVKVASPSEMEMATPYGYIPIAWTELPPETILQMGEYFAQHQSSPDLIADRNWLNGVFAFEFGMARVGRTLLVEAAQTQEKYTDDVALFIQTAPTMIVTETPAPSPAEPQPPAVATPSPITAPTAENVLREDGGNLR